MSSSPPLSPALAAAELLARRQGRRTLEGFTRYTFPRYLCEPAHALLAAALGDVVEGHCDRLMVFAPPQHGKSELASVRLPAYWLGRRPDDPVILTSYAASLAEDKSRQVREVVESDAYQALFPGLTTQPDSRARNLWHLQGRRGKLLAVGVGGPVTGHGGLLGIIDDPFENWEQAQSATMRQRVWDWWRATFRTRIWEGGAVILVMTRWHPDDLAGRLLDDQAGRWRVLRLPATAETQQDRDLGDRLLNLPTGQADPLGRAPGEPLCPRRFSAAALAELRRDVGPVAWPAEYQGVPHDAEGKLFKRAWFRTFANLGDAYRLEDVQELFYRKDCVHFGVADPAGGASKSADLTAAGAFALTPAFNNGRAVVRRLLLLDVLRERLPLERIVPRLLEFCRQHRLDWLGIEDVFLQSALIREALRTEGMPPVRRLNPEGKCKLVRATPAIVRAEAGQVYLPRGAPWVDLFLAEVVQFTGNDDPHDDQVDVLAYAARHLAGQQDASRTGFKPYVVPT